MSSQLFSRQVRLFRNFSQQSRRNVNTKIDHPSIQIPRHRTWEYVSYLVVPPTIIGWIWKMFISPDHDHPPKFIAWPHMRIRERDFFWGDGNHSLFHGHNNPLPEGWEDDSPNKKLDEEGKLHWM